MKVGYFADGPWSHTTINMLNNHKEIEILFIIPRYETQDPILRDWAKKLKIPFIVESNVNNVNFIKYLKNFNADLFISMSFNQILCTDILSIPSSGFINCHAGKLPFYRGRNPLNWALINDEKDFGITVHYIDEGIDTGNIIIQDVYKISNNDNYSTLLNKAIYYCALSMAKAINKLLDGNIKIISQDSIDPVGSYFSKRVDGDENIDFNWSSREIFNFVRAISLPGPCARCLINEQEYAILKVKQIPDCDNYIAKEGEVVGVSKGGNLVKVSDGIIELSEIFKIDDQEKFIKLKPNFPIGTLLKKI